ncbi:MAG: hypothetical protein LLF75_05570 [Eubacteriales bacterium]|nr:hypothetical protein [Eubacteriales bacterium]
MAILLTLLRLLAFAVSTMGYVAFVRIFWKVPARASYIFVLSSFACLVYFAGLAGILLPVAVLLFFGGLILLMGIILKKKIKIAFNRSSISALNLAFFAALIALIASLIDTKFVHYDNFSHWAVVVKNMLITNRFPEAGSAIIDFKSYPLGSSAFLYYFCRVVGNGQGVMLTGQVLLLFACFYAVFGVIKDIKRFLLVGLLGLCCTAMAYFNISIRVNNLLVDFLLPALALASIAIVAAAEQKRYCAACFTALPVLALLVIVKSTGIFFAALCCAFVIERALRFRREDRSGTAYVRPALAVVLLSLVTLVLWNVHTATAFSGDTSKFGYDLQNLSAITIDKTPEQIRSITALFLKTAVSLDGLAARGILLFNVLAGAAYLIARFALHKRWKLLKTLLALDAAVVVYYAGILGMYIVSMPLDEALRLAGFDRYASSMALFLIGALAMRAVSDVENSFYRQQGDRRDYRAFKSLLTKNLYQGATAGVALIAALTLLSELNGMNSIKAAYPESIPARVEALVGDKWEAPDNETRYLFYSSDAENEVTSYYLPYVGRYFLFASQVDAVSGFSDETFMGQIQTYDKLVILESTPEMKAYLQKHANLPGLPGVYDVRATFSEAVIPQG